MASQEEVIVCPNCKIRNPKGSKTCVNCGFDIRKNTSPPSKPPQPRISAKATPVQPGTSKPISSETGNASPSTIYYPPQNDDFLTGRPGCLIFYLVWIVISAGITYYVIASSFPSINIGIINFSQMNMGQIARMTIYGSLLILFAVSLIGLWRMKNWARIIQIVYLVISLLLEILSDIFRLGLNKTLFSFQTYSSASELICIAVPRFALLVIPLWWFLNNRRRFS